MLDAQKMHHYGLLITGGLQCYMCAKLVKYFTFIFVFTVILDLVYLPRTDIIATSNYFYGVTGANIPELHSTTTLWLDYLIYNFAPSVVLEYKIAHHRNPEVELPVFTTSKFPVTLLNRILDATDTEIEEISKLSVNTNDSIRFFSSLDDFISLNVSVANYFGIDSSEWYDNFMLRFLYVILYSVLRIVCIVVMILDVFIFAWRKTNNGS